MCRWESAGGEEAGQVAEPAPSPSLVGEAAGFLRSDEGTGDQSSCLSNPSLLHFQPWLSSVSNDRTSLSLQPRHGASFALATSHVGLQLQTASDKSLIDAFSPAPSVRSHMQEVFDLCLPNGEARREIFHP